MIFPKSEWLSAVSVGVIAAIAALIFSLGFGVGALKDAIGLAIFTSTVVAFAYHSGLTDGRKQK